MPEAVELLKSIKRAAVEAVEASKPVQVCFGKVTSSSPLKISVEQKLILGEAQLILSRNVTDFTTEVTVNWSTENSGGNDEGSLESHLHTVAGKKKITVHKGLVVGDEVILLRQQGGQIYIVVDRLR